MAISVVTGLGLLYWMNAAPAYWATSFFFLLSLSLRFANFLMKGQAAPGNSRAWPTGAEFFFFFLFSLFFFFPLVLSSAA